MNEGEGDEFMIELTLGVDVIVLRTITVMLSISEITAQGVLCFAMLRN